MENRKAKVIMAYVCEVDEYNEEWDKFLNADEILAIAMAEVKERYFAPDFIEVDQEDRG